MFSLNLIFDWIVAASLRSSIIVLVILVLQRLLRSRLSPKWKYALWLPVLATILIPAQPILPSWARLTAESSHSSTAKTSATTLPATGSVRMDDPADRPATSTDTTPGAVSDMNGINANDAEVATEIPSDFRTSTNAPSNSAGTNQTLRSVAFEQSSWGQRAILASVWLLGAVVWSAVVCISYAVTLYRIRRLAIPVDPSHLSRVESLAKQVGLRQAPRVWLSPTVKTPGVCGAFRPILLLNVNFFRTLTPEEASFVLRHELMHVRRGDVRLNTFLCILLALHWFNPLLWYAFFRIRADREAACDEDVLRNESREQRMAYGRTLLKMESALPKPGVSLGFVGMLQKRQSLRERIHFISDPKSMGSFMKSLVLISMFLVGALGIAEATEPQTRSEMPGNSKVDGVQSNQPTARATIFRKKDDPSLPVVTYGDARFRYSGVASLSYSPDGKWLVTTSGREGPIFWDLNTGKMVRRFPAPKGKGMLKVCFSPDGKLLAGINYRNACVWNVASGKLLYELENGGATVSFTSDGKHVFVGAAGGAAAVLVETKTGRLVHQLPALKGEGPHSFGGAALSPDASLAIVITHQGIPRRWNLKSGKEILPRLEKGHFGEFIRSVKFTPDGRSVVVISGTHGGGKDHLRLFDPLTQKLQREIELSVHRIHSLAVSPDGSLFAIGSRESGVHLLDVTQDNVKVIHRLNAKFQRVVFSPDGKSLATSGPVRLWDVATGAEKFPRSGDGPRATAWEMVILPDGRTLISREGYTRVVHRDLKTGRVTRSMESPDRLNFAILEICPQTGGFLSTDAATLSQPLLKDSQLMADLKKHFSYVKNTCFSADGKRVAVLFSAYHARVYDRGSGKRLRQFGAPPKLDYSRPGCITLSADGKHVAFKYGATKEAWNVETGVRLPMPSWGPDHLNWRDEYQFAPDGTLSIKQKHEISFWDVERGKQLRTLKDKPHEVGAVAFSPDGKLMAHARKSSKGEVVLWDLQTGKVIRVLRGARGGAMTLCFTPDHKKLYASTRSTLTVGWDLSNTDQPQK